jgi:hypothetical protein
MQILERKFGTLQSSYTRAINKQEKNTGALFQPKIKVLPLDEIHSVFCFHYIHQNPIKAGLCTDFSGWHFSSFNEYCNAVEGICDRETAYEHLGIASDAATFVQQSKRVITDEKVLLNMEN